MLATVIITDMSISGTVRHKKLYTDTKVIVSGYGDVRYSIKQANIII
jgi:hypothetical protein